MKNHILFLTTALCGSLLFTGCGDNRQAVYENVEISALKEQIDDLQAQLSSTEAQLAARGNTADPSADLADLLAGSGANVRYRNGELIISIDNDILFRSGSATLTKQAKKSLSQVANVLKGTYAGNYLRVEGHTDNQPIVRTKKTWSDNWALSGGRARAVLKQLEKLGVSKAHISFAGYADRRPLGSNSTRTSRAQNRRVEIVILPVLRRN